ncbi:MAG: galactokinase [Luteolibacter sp.]
MEQEIIQNLHAEAQRLGLDIAGGTVRRTSSRFCLGIEHGDYNDMELFGIGTDRFIWLAFKANTSGRLRIHSLNFPDDPAVDFAIGNDCDPGSVNDSWERFPRGVDAILRREGYDLTTGFDAVLYGNIPGGGMSRSASLALNLILTFFEVNGIPDEGGMQVVDLAQMVENDFIGSPCGKLDQIMIYHAKEGMGTHFDPATGKIEHIPFGGIADSFRIVSLDTGTKRPGLEKSTYRIRRTECDAMKEQLSSGLGIASLAKILDAETYAKTVAYLESTGSESISRLKYLYEAQARFQGTLNAWRAGDIVKVGENFRADGIGLRDDYRISGRELETMCDIARTVEGVLGERMLGGGDKGASGAIIRPEALEPLTEAVSLAYPEAHPDFAGEYAIHSCRMVDGIVTFPLPFF